MLFVSDANIGKIMKYTNLFYCTVIQKYTFNQMKE